LARFLMIPAVRGHVWNFGFLQFPESACWNTNDRVVFFWRRGVGPRRRSIGERGGHMVAAAVMLQQDNADARPVASLSRAEVLTRYRHFREINKQHHSAVLNFLPKDTVISQARRIGLAQGKTLVLDSIDDLNLVFDLLIYTAPKDRSRAIDRYARAARLAPETDEALVLEAMRRARFSIISSVRRHTVAGLIVKDLFRGFEFWLVDEGLESSLPDEAVLATRLYTLEGFAMTAGVLVPLDIELIEYAIADTEAG
jgi:hypothetical protein